MSYPKEPPMAVKITKKIKGYSVLKPDDKAAARR